MTMIQLSHLYSNRHRYIYGAAILTLVAYTMWSAYPGTQQPRQIVHPFDYKHHRWHPIDYLIKDARETYEGMLSKETHDLHSAATAYRLRRGRHPPPGFDVWHKFAQENDALIVEGFFDQVYHDLTPFWAVPAKRVRQQANQFPSKISVRNRTVITPESDREWTNHWIDMMQKIQNFLPDLDMPINLMDEPRVIVPWEDIDRFVKDEIALRQVLPSRLTINDFSPLDIFNDSGKPVDYGFVGIGPYWDKVRIGCDPTSPSWHVPAANDFSGPPPVYCTDHVTKASVITGECRVASSTVLQYDGYVFNWTAAKDPCLQPELRESHGSFVEPLSQSTTRKLIPLFGGSKLPMNNDILIPAPMYWPENSMYSSGAKHGDLWEEKVTSVMWRGAATGGRNRAENWTRFHRHRFVSLLNGTQIRLAQQQPGVLDPSNFILKPYEKYRGIARQFIDLGDWLEQISEVAFTYLVCFPATGNPSCPYTDSFFETRDGIPMEHQFDYKYLPDLDGNSFSGRYLNFLRSTSLPLKATIYSEWHDSRLVPWVHFVPMHNSFVDIYGILEYFIGFNMGVVTEDGQLVMEAGHDEQAKKIALAGKEWAEKVLRREDMLIYMLRLLLEYARICDDERERLGFVEDLVSVREDDEGSGF